MAPICALYKIKEKRPALKSILNSVFFVIDILLRMDCIFGFAEGPISSGNYSERQGEQTSAEPVDPSLRGAKATWQSQKRLLHFVRNDSSIANLYNSPTVIY